VTVYKLHLRTYAAPSQLIILYTTSLKYRRFLQVVNIYDQRPTVLRKTADSGRVVGQDKPVRQHTLDSHTKNSGQLVVIQNIPSSNTRTLLQQKKLKGHIQGPTRGAKKQKTVQNTRAVLNDLRIQREKTGKINIDISSVLNSSYGGANFWLLIQDDFREYLWSYFIKHKNDLSSTMIDWLYLVKKEVKLSVKRRRMDNSLENMAFHKLIHFKPYFYIKFEITAPDTPQQNGNVECAFHTLFGKTRSMLNAARIANPLIK
jgi:hypothetical protein